MANGSKTPSRQSTKSQNPTPTSETASKPSTSQSYTRATSASASRSRTKTPLNEDTITNAEEGLELLIRTQMIPENGRVTKLDLHQALFHIAQTYRKDKRTPTDLIRAVAFNLEQIQQDDVVDQLSTDTANLTMDKIVEFLEDQATRLQETLHRIAESVVQRIEDRAGQFLNAIQTSSQAFQTITEALANQTAETLTKELNGTLANLQPQAPASGPTLKAIQKLEESLTAKLANQEKVISSLSAECMALRQQLSMLETLPQSQTYQTDNTTSPAQSGHP